jgi:DNA repair ATPase RecN
MLADANSKATVQASKDKITLYKNDITATLKESVSSGQNALKVEHPEADLAVIELLVGTLKSNTSKVKQYVPLFNDVEAGKAFVPKIEEKLKKVRELKKKAGVKPQELYKALMDADDVMGKAHDSEIYQWVAAHCLGDMQAILNAGLMPLNELEAEIADTVWKVQKILHCR